MTTQDLYAEPLAYPGTPVKHTGILVNDLYHEASIAQINALLERYDWAGFDARQAVVAVGSNASPVQIRRKLVTKIDPPLVVPITVVTAHNLIAGVSAHVSRPGYIPATPVSAEGETSRFAVLWLAPTQLAVMDATEPNYDRHHLPRNRYPLIDETGSVVKAACDIYISHHGYLTDPTGQPLRLHPQPEVIHRLLADLPALRTLAGETPESFMAAMRDPDAREQARQLFIREGRVRDQPISSG